MVLLRYLSFWLGLLSCCLGLNSAWGSTVVASTTIAHHPAIEASVGPGLFSELLKLPYIPSGSFSIKSEFQAFLDKKPFISVGYRTILKEAFIPAVRTVAKRLGPVGLAWSLYDLVWDGDSWTLPEEGCPPGEECGGYCWSGYGSGVCYPAPSAGCSSYLVIYGSGYSFYGMNPYSYSNGEVVTYQCRWQAKANPAIINNMSYSSRSGQPCPTGQHRDSGGRCVQDGNRDATDAEIDQRIDQRLLSASDAAKQQAAKHPLTDLLPLAQPLADLTGPATLSPTTSTETKTENGVTQTINKTRQYELNYLSNPARIVTKVTETTVKHYSDGRPSETTTMVYEGDSTSNSGGSTDWPAFCDWADYVCDFIDWVKNPLEPPSDPLLPTQDVTPQTWDSGLSSGTCPSPTVISLIDNKVLEYKYDDACWAASNVFRPVLLSLAAIWSAMIIVGVKL